MSAKTFTAIGIISVVIGAVALLAVPTEALRAQGSQDRFLVTEIEGGIMRVDRQTGEVSVCKERRGKWKCRLVPDDRLMLEREIDDLERDNSRLRQADRNSKKKYDDMEDDMGDGGFLSPEEVDKAMNSVERMMERFIDTARQIRRRLAEEDKNSGN